MSNNSANQVKSQRIETQNFNKKQQNSPSEAEDHQLGLDDYQNHESSSSSSEEIKDDRKI
jgi:hypothetical protein